MSSSSGSYQVPSNTYNTPHMNTTGLIRNYGVPAPTPTVPRGIIITLHKPGDHDHAIITRMVKDSLRPGVVSNNLGWCVSKTSGVLRTSGRFDSFLITGNHILVIARTRSGENVMKGLLLARMIRGEGTELMIDHICTDPARGSQGLGTNMMHALFAFARANGIRYVRASIATSHDYDGQTAFISRFGFQAVGHRARGRRYYDFRKDLNLTRNLYKSIPNAARVHADYSNLSNLSSSSSNNISSNNDSGNSRSRSSSNSDSGNSRSRSRSRSSSNSDSDSGNSRYRSRSRSPAQVPASVYVPSSNTECVGEECPVSLHAIPAHRSVRVNGRWYDAAYLKPWFDQGHKTVPLTRRVVSTLDRNKIRARALLR